ncbi:serine hydrolase domain-containing protein [Sphingomicrobium arenosum]|uniref:serine hydrolase domain-containing protein n=1 Tax=Sphingomicrobium arenosum TaxID=2233861 RepID=UPI0022407E11|nr:serine hydrolase domain-containing protein [Sphingomicrobium arenosum]
MRLRLFALVTVVGLLSSAGPILAQPDFTARLTGPVSFSDDPPPGRSLQQRMVDLQIPMLSVAIIEDGSLVLAQTFHSSAKEAPACPIRFQVGSLSKPVTAALTVQLAQEGRADLHGPLAPEIRDVIAQDPDLQPPTLAQLLSHSGGITVHGFRGYAVDEAQPTLAQVIAGEAPANSAPIRQDMPAGAAVRYSGGGYVLLQQALENNAGTSLEQLARSTLFHSAGMTASSFNAPDRLVADDCLASGTDAQGNPIPGGHHDFPEAAAAGLWSTAADMGRFVAWLMNEENSTIAQQMLTPQSDTDGKPFETPGGNASGLGLVLEGEGDTFRFMHSGSNPGFKALMIGFPQARKGAVILTNSDAAPPVMQEILRAIAEEYHWPDRFHEVVEPLAAGWDRTALMGDYDFTSRSGQSLSIRVVEDGEMLAIETPDGRRSIVRPAADGRFIDPTSGATFRFPEENILLVPAIGARAVRR